jgi:hypothetical protein
MSKNGQRNHVFSHYFSLEPNLQFEFLECRCGMKYPTVVKDGYFIIGSGTKGDLPEPHTGLGLVGS